MSVYQRDTEARTCRKWQPFTGDWIDVPYDAPETTPRKSNEGMFVLPTNQLADGPDGPPVIAISDLLNTIRRNPKQES